MTFPVPNGAPFDPSVHNIPPALQPTGPSAQQIDAWRTQFITMIVQQVLLAVQGFFTPDPNATAQLQQWWDDTAAGIQDIIDQIFAGITGLFLPGTPSPTMGDAQTSQTAVLAAIARSVAQINAQLAANDPSIIEASDDLERVTTSGLGTNWQITLLGNPNGAKLYLDGHQAQVAPSGFGAIAGIGEGFRCRWIGTNSVCTTDYMMVEIVLGTQITPTGDDKPFIEVMGRANSTSDTLVAARLYSDSLKLVAINSGVETQIGTTQPAINPGVGSTISVQFGTESSVRQFRVNINDVVYTFDDNANVSAVGASFRSRGFTMYAGVSLLIFQVAPGPVAHWATIDVAVPPPMTGVSLTPKLRRPNYGALLQL